MTGGRTRPLTIVSQLAGCSNAIGRRVAAELPARFPDVRFIELPPGNFDVPPEAEVLLPWRVGPSGKAQRDNADPAPSGWPFNLKWVQLLGAGSDGFPRWLFTGPPVSCLRGPTGRPIAEYVIAVILSDLKSLPDLAARHPADWGYRQTRSVHGASVGIVGFGPIGRTAARYALAMGMEVCALRRGDAPFDVDGVERAADLADIFRRSDFVVLAMPSTPETDRIVDAAMLAHAKTGMHLINVGRGAAIDDDALLAAVRSGTVRRATLDATEPEPLPEGHPFYAEPGITVTAHSSGTTDRLEDDIVDAFARNIGDYIAGKPFKDVVDLARGY